MTNDCRAIVILDPFLVLLKRISDFADLPAKWDSYSAAPIKVGAINEAKGFLILAASKLRVQGIEMTMPFAAPLPDGSLQLEWEDDDRLEIEIDEKGPLLDLDYEEMKWPRRSAEEVALNRAEALRRVVGFHRPGA